VFDRLWKQPPHGLGLMRRRSAYTEVSRRFGRQVHMAELGVEDLQRVTALAAALLEELTKGDRYVGSDLRAG